MEEQKQSQACKCQRETSFKTRYNGSIFWLIFWLIIFFPIAFVLLLTNTTVNISGIHYDLNYDGSRFWLGFWVLIFFPIAFLLLFLNGLSITKRSCHNLDC